MEPSVGTAERPTMLAPRWRAYDLQNAALDELPTARRPAWYRSSAIVKAAFAVALVYFALTETALMGVAAVLVALSAGGDWMQARLTAALLAPHGPRRLLLYGRTASLAPSTGLTAAAS